MTQKTPARSDVIMAGVGGRGVLMAGLLLAQAGMARYNKVAWAPSYAGAMRGGPCECTVVLSDDDIVSAVISQADAVIAIDSTQASPFEARVKPGGILIAEKAGLQEAADIFGLKLVRDDITHLVVPGVEMAVHMGSTQVANFILLGAYLEATKALPIEIVDEELAKRMTGKKAETYLDLNKKALREGAKLAAKRTA